MKKIVQKPKAEKIITLLSIAKKEARSAYYFAKAADCFAMAASVDLYLAQRKLREARAVVRALTKDAELNLTP